MVRRGVRYVMAGLLVGCLAGIAAGADRQLAERRETTEKLGQLRDFDARDWENAYTYNTSHDAIASNTSHDVCIYIGTIMEAAYDTYSAIFQFDGSMRQLAINAYATDDDFRDVAQRYGFRMRDVAGFYTPQGGGAIQLPYRMAAGSHPSVVLFHEGAHQFVHEAIDMAVPARFEQYFTEDSRRLNSTPIWLNEGLACYLETAVYDGEGLDVGRVNVSRLTHLQDMLRNGTAPSVEETVSRRYGAPFGVEHYAVAWGLVWYLRHDSDVAARDERRAALNRYIERVKLGCFEDPEIDFKGFFLKNGQPRADFPVAWREYVGNGSLAAFIECIAGDDGVSAWSERWKEWILKRDPRSAFGGTKRGDAVFNKGDLKLGR